MSAETSRKLNGGAAMSRVEEAVTSFRNGRNCCQAILATYGPEHGLEIPLAMRVAAGFGGGLRRGEICGAVSGSVAVLGLKYAGDDAGDREAREEFYRLVNSFTNRFEARCGSISCKELLGCDISKPEGLRAAREADLFNRRCTELVRCAGEILEEMLRAEAAT